MRLGIDFGTCFSSAAFCEQGVLTLIKDPSSLDLSMPSSVFVTPQGQIYVGRSANNQRQRDPLSYRSELKRELGKTTPLLLAGKPRKVEELVAHVLTRVKQLADDYQTNLSKTGFSGAVLTIPATYQEHKRHLMRAAAVQAGFQQDELLLLEEPVAAAHYYGQQSQMADGEILLVYDLGGGTFDTALLRKKGESFEFLALPAGIERCGGVDFDRAIYNDVLRRYPSVQQLILDQQNRAGLLARLLLADQCVALKHHLSEATDGTFSFMVPGTLDIIDYSMERATFNQMITATIEETLSCCRKMIQGASISDTQIKRVLLVGGSCRIPLVRQMLEQEFKRPLVAAADLELVVCQGAAIYAEQEQGRQDLEKHKVAVQALKQWHAFALPSPHIFALAIHKSGQLLASAADCNLMLWNIRTKQLQMTLTGHGKLVSSLAFSSDGQLLASGSWDQSIKIWTSTGQLLRTLTGHSKQINAVVFSPDGQMLASASADQTTKLWNPASGQLLHTLTAHADELQALAISPDGKILASGGQKKKEIYLWNAHTGQFLRTIVGHTGHILALAISSDNRMLASSSTDKTLKLWDLAHGQLLHTLSGHSDWPTALIFHPEGYLLASGGWDQTLKFWDTVNGQLLRSLNDFQQPVYSLAFSPDGQWLASGGADQTVRIWAASSMSKGF